MNDINYMSESILNIPKNERRLIAHVCNDYGVWKTNFTKILPQEYNKAKTVYKRSYDNKTIKLGNVDYIMISSNIMIANMTAIELNGHTANTSTINYSALKRCLIDVSFNSCLFSGNVHMPIINTGNWNKISNIINSTLTNVGIKVCVYNID